MQQDNFNDEQKLPFVRIPDYSCPWHDSFVQSRKEIQKNLHILHPAMKSILDICHSTFSHLLLIDLSDCRYCTLSTFMNLKRQSFIIHAVEEKQCLMFTCWNLILELVIKVDRAYRLSKPEEQSGCGVSESRGEAYEILVPPSYSPSYQQSHPSGS